MLRRISPESFSWFKHEFNDSVKKVKIPKIKKEDDC